MWKTVLPLSFILSTLFACSPKSQPTAAPVPKVKTFTVNEQAKGQQRRLSGVLQPASESILSFPVTGTLTKVMVQQGEHVTQGQILAQLEQRPFELALANARAQLTTSRAQFQEKQQRYQRLRALGESQFISAADLDASEAELSSAGGNLTAAQNAVEDAERNLADSTLASPFSGRISVKSIASFESVTPGKQSFILQSDGHLEAEVLVPETIIRNIDYGQAVQVAFPTMKDVYSQGLVNKIGSQVEAGNAFPVSVQLLSQTESLRPGMSATVTFNFNQYLNGKDVFMIPLQAIALDAKFFDKYQQSPSQDGNNAPVYIFDPNTQTVQLREILVGNLRDNQVEVFEGLAKGDQVVVAGVAFLRDGMSAQRWNARTGLAE